MSDDGSTRRYIPPGSCTWCGHPPHTEDCTATIKTLVDPRAGTQGGEHQAPCPCVRHKRARTQR